MSIAEVCQRRLGSTEHEKAAQPYRPPAGLLFAFYSGFAADTGEWTAKATPSAVGGLGPATKFPANFDSNADDFAGNPIISWRLCVVAVHGPCRALISLPQAA